MILSISAAATQETVQGQFTSECPPLKTANVPLSSLGDTSPGQKVPGLSSEGTVRLHRGAQGRTVN